MCCFVKQKTAYKMLRRLGGSEMWIRDRIRAASMHRVDALIGTRWLGLRVHWLLELGSLLVIAAGAALLLSLIGYHGRLAWRARILGRWVGALAAVIAVIALVILLGVGVIGTRVEESSGGALAADATLIAPAGPAFSIWTPIYLGLAAYTVWQWLPDQATDRRHRAIGWLAAASMVLNALWLLVTQQGWLWASVGVIAALVVTLGVDEDLLDRPEVTRSPL